VIETDVQIAEQMLPLANEALALVEREALETLLTEKLTAAGMAEHIPSIEASRNRRGTASHIAWLSQQIAKADKRLGNA
jgi:hypothetical protein